MTLNKLIMRKKANLTNEQIQLNQEWQDVRTRLVEFPPSFHPNKTVELLNLCRASPVLRKLRPYISMGRLCLTQNVDIERLIAEGKQFSNHDSPCLWFHDEYYMVSGCDLRDKWPFANAHEAVNFLQQHPVSIPPLEDYNVQVLPAALCTLALDWLNGTAVVELQCVEKLVRLHLAGVSWCEMTRCITISETDPISKIQYDHRQLLIWLSSGNFITITATGLEVKEY